MFNYLSLICALALVFSLIQTCYANEGDRGEGPCKAARQPVKSVSLKGRLYTWGRRPNSDQHHCLQEDFDPDEYDKLPGFKDFLGTDDHNFVIVYNCIEKGDHHYAKIWTFTRDKNPSVDVRLKIKQAHRDNGSDQEKIFVACK